ncbi:hypothetical protein [Spiroplasma sp. TIUS-1]|uniref:hypothetical protein n=1 Tax=Spiroplasma sp. TIUS-1 TaxID=216963 RepID=UPI0013A6C643|nr:hypothetical protein [Spiroplasma sp. TIUS-1]
MFPLLFTNSMFPSLIIFGLIKLFQLETIIVWVSPANNSKSFLSTSISILFEILTSIVFVSIAFEAETVKVPLPFFKPLISIFSPINSPLANSSPITFKFVNRLKLFTFISFSWSTYMSTFSKSNCIITFNT